MTICPIAIAVGCKKCPAFKICPLKGVLGDQPEAAPVEAKPKAKPTAKPKAKSSGKPRAAAPRK